MAKYYFYRMMTIMLVLFFAFALGGCAPYQQVAWHDIRYQQPYVKTVVPRVGGL